VEIRASFSHQNWSANGQFHSVHFDEMADAGHLHRGISMPEINTEFLFTIALEIQVSSLGDTPYGSRRIFYFDAGSFDGPKLKGTVLPGGGGSSRIRRDDALEVDVQLILETDDKHQIYMAWKDFAMVRRRSWTAFIAARSSTREPTISAPRLTSRRVQKSTAG
jgi:Protein of unknown function (DUF3237)